LEIGKVFMIPTLRAGSAVDGYLAAESAIAQAIDPNTILLSSALLAMNRRDRRLLLLHEWAHVKQLARPGRDPVRAIEGEAWEAAFAWAAGRPFRIRGRARGRLNAIAIIQGGTNGHPHAPPWYRINPAEPIGGSETLAVSDTTVHDSLTLEAILDIMIRSKDREYIVVCHGDPDGLALPLMKGAKSGASKVTVLPLSADRQNSAGGATTPVISEESLVELTKLRPDEVSSLRQKMSQVRAMKLNHVAFRACNMAESTDQSALEAFRNFFGATSVSAPRDFDAYGHFKPALGGNVDAWAKQMRKNGYHVAVNDAVGLGTKRAAGSDKFRIVAKAASKDAMSAWIRKHVVNRSWSPSGVTFHGIRISSAPANPEDPLFYFVKDARYLASIVNFSG
jgi:hypothetical protein